MIIKTTFNKLISLGLYIFASLLIVFITNSSYADQIESVEIACIVHMLLLMFMVYYLERQFISFSFVFMCLCMMFFYGQVFVQLFNVDVFEAINVYEINDTTTIIEALKFTMLSMHFVGLGILITNFLKKDVDVKILANREKLGMLSFKVGCALFFIGLGPKLLIDFSRLYLYSLYHYNLKQINLFGGYVSTLSNICEYGLIAMVISGYKSKKFNKYMCLVAIIYQLIPILCGVRARSVVFIITLLFFYIKTNEDFKPRNYIKYIIIGYFTLILLNVISQIRQSGISWNTFFESFKLNSLSSPLFTALEEYGNTLGSVCYIMRCVPEHAEHSWYCFNPIIRCLSIFPNIGGFLKKFNNIMYTNTNFDMSLIHSISLGGTFVCELYFDYGKYGYMAGIYIGLFVGIIERLVNSSLRNKNSLSILFLLPLCTGAFWWVRDHFVVIPREFTWNAILVLIILNIIRKRKNIENA